MRSSLYTAFLDAGPAIWEKTSSQVELGQKRKGKRGPDGGTALASRGSKY